MSSFESLPPPARSREPPQLQRQRSAPSVMFPVPLCPSPSCPAGHPKPAQCCLSAPDLHFLDVETPEDAEEGESTGKMQRGREMDVLGLLRALPLGPAFRKGKKSPLVQQDQT